MTTASAPGKVLLCGGYLVLERPNVGLVVAVSARFRTTLRLIGPLAPTPDAGAGDTPGLRCCITVVSKQFDSTLVYDFCCSAAPRHASLAIRGEGDSPFIRAALLASLAVVCSATADWARLQELLHGQHFGLELLADNAFYSQAGYLARQGGPITREAVRAVPAGNTDIRDGDGTVMKTGLGSSACLVTSIVGCVLHHFGVLALPAAGTGAGQASEPALQAAHTVAQFSHCYAQGKVGSGFDVCAAVYGSGVYRRFDPAVLTEAMGIFAAAPVDCARLYTALDLNPATPSRWNHTFQPCGLPPPLTLVLADVSQGSSSPGMASTVLRWKAAAPVAERLLWTRLAELNPRLVELFDRLRLLAAEHTAEYEPTMAALATLRHDAWQGSGSCLPVVQCLLQIRALFTDIRACLKGIGDHCNVGIEPDGQTALLEATLAVPGVLIAGVPGAGGHDAVFAILVHPTAREAVEELWLHYGEGGGGVTGAARPSVLPLVLEENPTGLLVQ